MKVKVVLADAPTDVLVFLAALSPRAWYSTLGVLDAIGKRGAPDAFRTINNAMQLLFDAGYIEGERVDGCAVFRATDAGRRAVAAAEPCAPMGTNARGVAQCADGHGDYPDACAEATP